MSGVKIEDSPPFVVTRKVDDQTFEGVWSRASDTTVVFADHILDGTSVTHHGGPVAGDPSGHPVQLIFWGDWWNQADGAARRALFEQRVQDLLETPYFHELEQYGVHAPVWRGSTTVTRPGPPGTISVNGAMTASLDLIDDLIDDDVFPDPDDGARFAFLVLMPPGFVIQDANPANGAHYYDYDQDGPFDRDNYWAGWIRYFDPAAGENPEDTMRTLSHELVELLTDPEGDGWHTERGGGSNEVSDAGQSPGIGYQTAVVGGARVQSYWSQSRNRTVLPLEPGYSARLSAVTHETARRDLDSGTFRPEAGQLAFCVADREYWWKTEEIDQRVTVTLATRLFHSPKVTWRIAGQEVSGSGRIRVSTTIDGFNGRDSLLSPAVVAIDYEVQPDRLILNVPSPGGSFDFDVACTVRDGQITGRTQSEPTSSPAVNVGLQGAIIELDPSYSDQVEACLKELIGRWKQVERPFRKPRPGDPIDQLGGLLTSTLPAYTSGIEYARARMVEQAAHAAAIVLAPEEAASYVRGALTLVPTSRTRLPAGELMRVVGVRQAAYAALKAQRAREAGTSG
ncbi:MAG: hypothetical protein JSS74_17125 [Actinobacteria bacterium]|nr:hypothetical protein [Actinomycetota bacterium]